MKEDIEHLIEQKTVNNLGGLISKGIMGKSLNCGDISIETIRSQV